MSTEILSAAGNSQSSKGEAAISDLPTPELIGKIYYHSFKFSQGLPSLQDDIFSYVHLVYPDWKLDDSMRDEVIRTTEKAAERIVLPSISPIDPEVSVLHKTNPDVVSASYFRHDYKRTFNFFQMELDSSEAQDPNLIKSLFYEILDRDYKFLITNGGRDRVNIPAGKELAPAYDKFLSHLIYYGLEGNPTGLSVYNRMFSDVRDYLFDNYNELPEHIRYSLSKLVSVYETHHPGSKINLP